MPLAKSSRFRWTIALFLFWVVPTVLSAQQPVDAQLVYVVGAVKKPGGYALRKGQTITIVEVLELSGGLTETAAKGSAKVIRRDENGTASQIPLDLNKVLRGKTGMVKLIPGDILFVPDKRKRKQPYYDRPWPELNGGTFV
jgi:protein involved in polysaccharide export with SLBB domain